MIMLLEEACGRKAQCELLPMQPGDVAETFADIGPICDDLGFSPKTSLDIGVPRFVNWYKDYRAKS